MDDTRLDSGVSVLQFEVVYIPLTFVVVHIHPILLGVDLPQLGQVCLELSPDPPISPFFGEGSVRRLVHTKCLVDWEFRVVGIGTVLDWPSFPPKVMFLPERAIINTI